MIEADFPKYKYEIRYRRGWKWALRLVLGIIIGIPLHCVEVLMSFIANTCRYILETANQKLPFPEPRFYDAEGNEVHNVVHELDEDGNLTIHE